MLFNKEKRIKYLGFDDKWYTIIGILIIGVSTSNIFSPPNVHPTSIELIITFIVSVFFSACYWLINRLILIQLRKLFPSLKDNVKRIALLFFCISMNVIVVEFIGFSLISWLGETAGGKFQYGSFQERTKILIIIVFIAVMVMAIYEAIYFFGLLKKSIREEEQAKQAIIQAQLDSLQNKAQPHFFFNTLNTLRDIIDRNSKEKSKQFVDQLSEIYRFLLESSNVNLISLRKELKFSKAYIHIQKERFGNNLKLNWNIPEDALEMHIAPMALQLLLENAIKHNVISKNKPLTIDIEKDGDYIWVKNRIQKKSTQLPSTKMGLKNIEKRYQLISNKAVEIIYDGQEFSVALPLLTYNPSNP